MGLAAYCSEMGRPIYSLPPVAEARIECDCCGLEVLSTLQFGSLWICPLCFEGALEVWSNRNHG